MPSSPAVWVPGAGGIALFLTAPTKTSEHTLRMAAPAEDSSSACHCGSDATNQGSTQVLFEDA